MPVPEIDVTVECGHTAIRTDREVKLCGIAQRRIIDDEQHVCSGHIAGFWHFAVIGHGETSFTASSVTGSGRGRRARSALA